jgi:type IV pilus assembly protein PilE
MNAAWRQPRSRGFTLIEIMITIAIVGIIAAIALPSYRESIAKGRRTDAQAALNEAAQFMERFYTENARYDQTVAGVAVALPAGLTSTPRGAVAGHYAIGIPTVARESYTLRAVPQNSQVGDRCGNMTLTHTGVRAASMADCWRR